MGIDSSDEDLKPNLGCATTEELFEELIARFTVYYPHNAINSILMTGRAIDLAKMLGGLDAVQKEYRTIDGY